MTPQEIRQLADRLATQSRSIWMNDRTSPAFKRYAQEVIEWYTAQLQVLADRRAKAAASDIDDLDDMLVVRHLNPRKEGETLRQAIDRIINWEATVNLDPTVSSAARELVERGRAEARQVSTATDDEISCAVHREAAAWREIVRRERLRADEALKQYHALLSSLASLSQMLAQPRVVVDPEKLQPDDELGQVLAARGWL